MSNEIIRLKRVCLVTRLGGVAGPAAFQRRLADGLRKQGIDLSYSLADRPYGAVLVIGGTRWLGGLLRAGRAGVPIVQRLAGINWLHRQTRTGPRHYLRSEANNLLVRLIRGRLADRLVYQSEFARGWWERCHGTARARAVVVHNGVPLRIYTPDGDDQRPRDAIRLLMVEGNFAGGYELGLGNGVNLAGRLAARLNRPIELTIAGNAPRPPGELPRGVRLDWRGLVDPDQIPALDRSAHLLFAADLNPACPNAAIEAMACGLPVIAFATGALPELVQGDSGRLAPYGGDPWKLEPPDLEALVEAGEQVLGDQPRFRSGARSRAEAAFGLERMVDGYLQELAG
ncbi:MAG: glycosyltransferase family 4 protein [Anaerolineales bacterium]